MIKRLASVVFGLLVGCGGSSAAPGGGDGGGGGTDGGGGGDAGGGITADQACADTAHARCTLLESCSAVRVQVVYGDEATCESRIKQNCVNALAAPSTGNTPAATEACAQAYAGWACADFLDGANVPQACAQVTGSLASGAACEFAGQCQSGFCAIVPGAACGTCAAPPKAGDSCAQLTTCGNNAGLTCTQDTQTCVVLAAQGAACGKGAPCGTGLSCVGADAATSTQGTCQAAGTQAGATCDPQLKTAAGCSRDAGLTCNAQSKQCATITVVGGSQPCDDVNNQAQLCSAGGQCTETAAGKTGTCTAAAADGAACDTQAGPPCLSPARCIASGTGTAGTCQLPTASACH